MHNILKIAVLAAIVPLALCDCQSFGIDFQSGGTYFQNSLSTDPFTALQQFEGCQNDTSHNVIVDPAGDQSECTQTPMQPNDTNAEITCAQWPKNTLYSGAWSLLIVSNNGDANPIAYERDFSLTVGPQQTVTAPTPTISGGPSSTKTITPPPISTNVTAGFIQFTNTITSTVSTSTTVVVPASCSVSRSSQVDPLASIIPSILGNLNILAASIVSKNSVAKRSEPTEMPLSAKFKRDIIEGRTPSEDAKQAFLKARIEGLEKQQQLNKRAPDAPTVTITPAPVYVTATVTAQPVTATSTSYVLFYITTITTTSTKISTTTLKTTSSGAAASCSSSGGVLV